jgi:hypothetical protein
VRAPALAAAVLVALLAGAAPARGDDVDDAEVSDPAADAILAAHEEGRFGDAYRLGEALTAERPDDPWVRYLAGWSAFKVARHDAAHDHVAAGLAAHPDDVNLLGLRATLRLIDDDDDGAHARRARARWAGEDPGLAAGSPEAFVDGLCAAIAQDAPAETIADAFSLELVGSLRVGQAGRPGLVSFVRGAIAGMRRSARNADQQALGWVVADEATPVGERWEVLVAISARRGPAPASRRW